MENTENTPNPLADLHSNSVKETINVETPQEVIPESNYLADVHNGTVTPIEETEENRNHYATESVESEQLGEVPNELPTELGGVVMENVEEPTPETQSDEDGDVSKVQY